jgi:hypothetical protein
LKIPSMKVRAKKPGKPLPPKSAKPPAPKVLQAKARPASAPARPAALSAPGVVQARMANFQNGPKIAAPPVYRPVAKKIVQPKMASPKFLGSSVRTIQRAEEPPKRPENPYSKDHQFQGKTKKVRSSKRASAQASPYGEKAIRSDRVRARMGGSGIRPASAPTKDNAGRRIWDGARKSLRFTDTINTAMAATAAGGCQIQDPGCTHGADAIDHIVSFADRQSEIEQNEYCDGNNHWVISYLDDAMAIYNNNDDPSNMQWSCTKCNSAKSGAQGLYQNQPTWGGPCPGEECDIE